MARRAGDHVQPSVSIEILSGGRGFVRHRARDNRVGRLRAIARVVNVCEIIRNGFDIRIGKRLEGMRDG